MEHTRSGSDILVRLDPGEEIHTSLKKLADDLGFDALTITSGIGRTRENQYGYMNSEGVYKRRYLESPSELVSFIGKYCTNRRAGRHSPTYTAVGLMMTTVFTLAICSNQQFKW